jgi:hypothetical protein
MVTESDPYGDSAGGGAGAAPPSLGFEPTDGVGVALVSSGLVGS